MYTHAYALSLSLPLSSSKAALTKRNKLSSNATVRHAYRLTAPLVVPRPPSSLPPSRPPPTPPFHSRQVVSSPSTEIDATRGSRVQSATGHRVRNVVPSNLLLFCLRHPSRYERHSSPLFPHAHPFHRIHVSSLDVFFVEIRASHSYAFINRMWIYEIEPITCDVAADGVSTEFVSK